MTICRRFWLTRSREAAKGCNQGAVFEYEYEYEYEYRFTEYGYERRFFGGVSFVFFVLVLSPPWRAVLVLVLDFNTNGREFPCRWVSSEE